MTSVASLAHAHDCIKATLVAVLPVRLGLRERVVLAGGRHIPVMQSPQLAVLADDVIALTHVVLHESENRGAQPRGPPR